MVPSPKDPPVAVFAGVWLRAAAATCVFSHGYRCFIETKPVEFHPMYGFFITIALL
jgi:hypothetical protein